MTRVTTARLRWTTDRRAIAATTVFNAIAETYRFPNRIRRMTMTPVVVITIRAAPPASG
jgi:hypothetical protein